MSKKAALQVIEASGRPFELGRAIGKKCASKAVQYRKSIAASVEFYTGFKWKEAVERAELFLPFAEDFDSDHVEELKGFADGSKISFGEIFALSCHELLSPTGFKGCTDVAVNGDVTSDGRVLAAHNEDWSPTAQETVVLLHAKPKGKPEFIAACYAGFLPSCGMNSAGISLTGNALSPNDSRIGIPKSFPVRKVLEAKRVGEALEYAMPDSRASSYNNIVSDKNGEIYSLEGSATDCAWIYAIDGYLVHTNHYVAEKMQRFEEDPSAIACSVFRYNRALRLVEDQLGSVTVESLHGLLSDHVNKPGSICRHPTPGVDPLDISETIFSVIFDLTNLEAHILKGKPCTGGFVKYSLGE